MWDRYATFASIAGVDPTDHRAAKAGLPALDSISHWGHWSGAVTPPRSPRTSLAIGSCNASSSRGHNQWTNGFDEWCGSPSDTTTVAGLIVRDSGGLWKLLVQPQIPMNGWTGPLSPNSTETHYEQWYELGCGADSEGGGCLFNLDTDPTEHHNVAMANPTRVAAMTKQISLAQQGAFSPSRGSPQLETACAAAQHTWNGFWGPFVE